MLYEIGWSSYDMRYIIPVLCFIPLFVLFVLLQKRYDTSDEGSDVQYSDVRNRGNINIRGSKSTTKFMISAILVVLMIGSLSPIMTIAKKYKNITSYKSGEYEIFTGTVDDIYSMYSYYSVYIESQNGENKALYVDEPNNVEEFLKKGEEYTIYYTYSISEKTGEQ